MALIWDNSTIILAGMRMTFALMLVALFFSTLLAVLFGTLSITRFPILRLAARTYSELLRDVPLIVNVFIVFFVTPLLGVPMSPFAAVTTALSLWGGANGAEIVRGGIASVSRHQWNSAAALGLKPWETFVWIIVPQALKSIIPPFTGLSVQLIQATALGALLGVNEFFRVGQIIIERTTVVSGQTPALMVYTVILIVYFVICSTLTWLSRHLERRLRLDQIQSPGRQFQVKAAVP